MKSFKSFFHQFKQKKTASDTGNNQSDLLNEKLEKLQDQIQTALELSRVAIETTDDHQIMKAIADLLQQRCLLHYIGIFLIDKTREYAVLHYGTGDQGQQMLASSYRLAVGGYSLVGNCIQAREQLSIIVNDSNPARFENPFLPQSRSELALPLIKNDQLLGVLDVHSAAAKAMESDTIALVKQAANLLAISLNKTYQVEVSKGSGFLNLDELQKDVKHEIKELSVNYSNPAYQKPRLKGANHSIPLLLQHETVGSLDLEMDDQPWTEDREKFTQAVVAQSLSALESKIHLDQTIHHAEGDRRILEVTSKIRSTNDTQMMLQIALEEISRHLGVSRAQIVLNVPEIPRATDSLPTTNTKSLQKKMTTGKLPEL